MIEKLEQLTVAQFVDLICGDTTVLLGKREVATPAKLTECARNIVLEYHTIADESGAKAYLSYAEDFVKAKVEVAIYTICSNLVKLGEHGRAREVMLEHGINAESMTDQRVTAEVKSRLERAKNSVEKLEKEAESEVEKRGDIRTEFDAQTAQLMAYYKFQIDTATMKATVYAHLIARHNREIKSQLAAMKKK